MYRFRKENICSIDIKNILYFFDKKIELNININIYNNIVSNNA
jgi:hypothetical protein